MIEYLGSQKMIQELAVRDLSLNHYLCDLKVIKAVQFPLKKLSLWKLRDAVRDEEKLLAFLENFVDTLEFLELRGHYPNSVYEMIFKKFLKLKVLKVGMNQTPKNDEFYHNLRPNQSIQKFIIIDSEKATEKSIEGFIGNLPNIETLVMGTENVSNNLLVFISNNLPKLKSLNLNTIKGHMIERVCIGSVTSLRVKKTGELEPNDWKLSVKAFPNVNEFSIEKVWAKDALSDRMFNIFTKGWKMLNHLKFGHGFKAVKRIFNQLLRNCKDFKTFELIETNFDHENNQKVLLKDFNKDGLRLIVHSEDSEPFSVTCDFWKKGRTWR